MNWMLRTARENLERRLFHRGFASADIRRIVSGQILVADAALAVGFVCLWFSVWPFFFGVGAALAAHNLWWLARSVEWSLRHDYTRSLAVANFLAFLGRFGGMGIALVICIAWLKAPVVPLVAGLSTALAGMTLWGFTRFLRQHSKETPHGRQHS